MIWPPKLWIEVATSPLEITVMHICTQYNHGAVVANYRGLWLLAVATCVCRRTSTKFHLRHLVNGHWSFWTRSTRLLMQRNTSNAIKQMRLNMLRWYTNISNSNQTNTFLLWFCGTSYQNLMQVKIRLNAKAYQLSTCLSWNFRNHIYQALQSKPLNLDLVLL